MFCIKCGKENTDTSKFCFSCGNPMATQAVAKQEAPQVNIKSSDVPKYQCASGEKKSHAGIIVGVIILAVVGVIIFVNTGSSVSQEEINKMRALPILYQTNVGPATTGVTFGKLIGHPDVKVTQLGSILYVSLEDIKVTCNLEKVVTESGDVEVITVGDNQFGNIEVLLTKIKQLNNKSEGKILGIIKEGHFSQYPNKTIGEAFTVFFGKPSWEYLVNQEGGDIVEFKGRARLNEQWVNVKIQFHITDRATGVFNVVSFTVDNNQRDVASLPELLARIYQ